MVSSFLTYTCLYLFMYLSPALKILYLELTQYLKIFKFIFYTYITYFLNHGKHHLNGEEYILNLNICRSNKLKLQLQLIL